MGFVPLRRSRTGGSTHPEFASLRTLRSQDFSPSQRLTPRQTIRSCFIPVASMGFTLQSCSLSRSRAASRRPMPSCCSPLTSRVAGLDLSARNGLSSAARAVTLRTAWDSPRRIDVATCLSRRCHRVPRCRRRGPKPTAVATLSAAPPPAASERCHSALVVRRPLARDTSRLLPPAATNRCPRHGARTPRRQRTVAHLQGTRRRSVAQTPRCPSAVRRPRPSLRPEVLPAGSARTEVRASPPGLHRLTLGRHPPQASARSAPKRGACVDPLACAGLTTSEVLAASPGEPKLARCRWQVPPLPRATPSDRHRPRPPKWLRHGWRLASAGIWTSTAGPVARWRAEALAPNVHPTGEPSSNSSPSASTAATPKRDGGSTKSSEPVWQPRRASPAVSPARGRLAACVTRHALGRPRTPPRRRRLAEARSCRSQRRPRPVRATRGRLPAFNAGARGLRRVQSGGPTPGLPLQPFHLRGRRSRGRCAPQASGPEPTQAQKLTDRSRPGAVAPRPLRATDRGRCLARRLGPLQPGHPLGRGPLDDQA
jgi:hypothetical protein